MATARDLITRALKACRILAPGENPSASEAADALMILNMMLSSWSTDNLNVFAQTLESFSLVSNVSSYTIGTGQTFNTVKPIAIQTMYVRSGSVDYTVKEISDRDYANEISMKSIVGVPYCYNFNNDYPSSVIKFYPVPDQNYQLFILSEKALTSIASLDTVISFPEGWELAIAYNLAVMLFPEYQQAVDPAIVKIADNAKMGIRRAINRNRKFVFGDDEDFRQTDNIYAGWFR
jgi:hypothetical protein